jgi:hypothetical protein
MAEPFYPDYSAQQTETVTPTGSTSLLTSLGWSYDGSLRAVAVVASASGVYVNFVGAASTTSFPIPTAPYTLPLRPEAAATAQALGNGSATLSIVNINSRHP